MKQKHNPVMFPPLQASASESVIQIKSNFPGIELNYTTCNENWNFNEICDVNRYYR